MKIFKQNYRGFLAIAAVSLTLFLAGASSSFADYRHDNSGYWDSHHRHHNYEYYHHHRGYWGQRNGVRIFINL